MNSVPAVRSLGCVGGGEWAATRGGAGLPGGRGGDGARGTHVGPGAGFGTARAPESRRRPLRIRGGRPVRVFSRKRVRRFLGVRGSDPSGPSRPGPFALPAGHCRPSHVSPSSSRVSACLLPEQTVRFTSELSSLGVPPEALNTLGRVPLKVPPRPWTPLAPWLPLN